MHPLRGLQNKSPGGRLTRSSASCWGLSLVFFLSHPIIKFISLSDCALNGGLEPAGLVVAEATFF